MCEVCVLCFSEDPSGDISPKKVFFILSPTLELPPTLDRFPQKNYILPGGNSKDITVHTYCYPIMLLSSGNPIKCHEEVFAFATCDLIQTF